MALSKGLPPLQRPTGEEQLEKIKMHKLQRPFSDVTALPAVLSADSCTATYTSDGRASYGMAGWSTSRQRRQLKALTHFYDNLSDQYRAAMAEFHEDTAHQEHHDKMRAHADHFRSQGPTSSAANAKMLSASALPLRLTCHHQAKVKQALDTRDFSKSMMLAAEGLLGGGILANSSHNANQQKKLSKQLVAAKMRKVMSRQDTHKALVSWTIGPAQVVFPRIAARHSQS